MVLSFSDAKKISIIEYLSKLGFEPTKIRGNDYWYCSPLRHERDASFKVNNKLNVWYDHGSGEGGTLLDLGMKLHGCTLSEFVERLGNENFSFHQVSRIRVDSGPEIKIEILSAKPIGDLALIQYLEGRKIDPDIAKRFCKEVQFKIKDRDYKAIGFPNRSGGYELRNSWFKGSSSPKDLTAIQHAGGKSICVTEGFFDFLSLHQLQDKEIVNLVRRSDFLVLNSIAFVQKSLPIISSYNSRELFLDNDQAAKKAKTSISESGLTINDRSSLYASFKDLNEFLTNGSSNNFQVSKSRGLRP
ncbi:toprim domain-containing protein [Chryseosolibacter indicus]|uniref:Toprim domain-containing protein n=1 Tax=Chryseosolibacter indicus TaxID=2782351 RepID=A0ABS5VWR5_9BACT|nr:toprim domain-containing protein [Chryseosolibacter indicus]MBT1705867.1 toprim domain-containing protein [Chryseosolibacter indicus]